MIDMMKRYDYLIIGCGLYGSVIAEQLTRSSRSCLVIDKRSHVGGNVYTEKSGILSFINMVLISFIQIIKLFGIILIHFQNLIDTQILHWLIIKVNFIACLLI